LIGLFFDSEEEVSALIPALLAEFFLLIWGSGGKVK
jgi:hypothetical protein